jgi:hypothetical protein
MGRLRELLGRPGAKRRWAVVIGGFAILLAAPAAIAARPVHVATDPSTATLLTMVAASGDVSHIGYAESAGRLNLPDLGQFEDVGALLAETSRFRVWWSDSDHYRVDSLAIAGEHDYYRNGDHGFEWNTTNRRASYITSYPSVRAPSPPDVLPGTLGRRLLKGVPASAVSRIDPRRVAGINCIGLQVRADDGRSTINYVQVWVDPANGLPLGVRVVPTEGKLVAFDTRYLSLSLTTPDSDRLQFEPEADPSAQLSPGQIDGGIIEGLGSGHRLPREVAGLTRRSRADDGTVTYGDRYTLLAVIPVRGVIASGIILTLGLGAATVAGDYNEGRLVSTALINAMIIQKGDDGFLLAGTVTVDTLKKAANDVAFRVR